MLNSKVLNFFSVVSCMDDVNVVEFKKLIFRINLSKLKEKKEKRKKKYKYQSLLSKGELLDVELFYVEMDVEFL